MSMFNMFYNRLYVLYVLASLMALIFVSLNVYLHYLSNQPQYACVNDDYNIFFTEVVIGNSYAPLHYQDMYEMTHYNYGADVVLVDGILTHEECQKYFVYPSEE